MPPGWARASPKCRCATTPRTFGKSKYGLERIFKVLLDLMVVKFLDRYLVKPIYVFGGFGLLWPGDLGVSRRC